MKIKTITHHFDRVEEFDDQVNRALEEGWRLVKREVAPGAPNDYARVYAELVQLDPAPEVAEPQPADPMDAVRVIKEACLAMPMEDCNTERCPLKGWCDCLAETSDPSDWKVPEKEAPRD